MAHKLTISTKFAEFSRRRFVLRVLIYALILLVALSIPTFSPILNLLGASTITLTALILPILFYLSLKHAIPVGEPESSGTAAAVVVLNQKASTPLTLAATAAAPAATIAEASGGSHSNTSGTNVFKRPTIAQ